MDEQALLKQINGMFQAQSAQIRAEIQDTLAAQEARMNQRFDETTTHITEVVHAVGEQFAQVKVKIAQQKAEIINEVRALAENIEGDKIRALLEESGAHRETLEDHEQRIVSLEGLAASAG